MDPNLYIMNILFRIMRDIKEISGPDYYDKVHFSFDPISPNQTNLTISSDHWFSVFYVIHHLEPILKAEFGKEAISVVQSTNSATIRINLEQGIKPQNNILHRVSQLVKNLRKKENSSCFNYVKMHFYQADANKQPFINVSCYASKHPNHDAYVKEAIDILADALRDEFGETALILAFPGSCGGAVDIILDKSEKERLLSIIKVCHPQLKLQLKL